MRLSNRQLRRNEEAKERQSIPALPRTPNTSRNKVSISLDLLDSVSPQGEKCRSLILASAPKGFPDAKKKQVRPFAVQPSASFFVSSRPSRPLLYFSERDGDGIRDVPVDIADYDQFCSIDRLLYSTRPPPNTNSPTRLDDTRCRPDLPRPSPRAAARRVNTPAKRPRPPPIPMSK